MDHTNEIAAFCLPAITLTPSQRSLIRFYDTVPYGIAIDKRGSGMTTSAIMYALWELFAFPKETTSVFIVGTGIQTRYMNDSLRLHSEMLNLPVSRNGTYQNGRFANSLNNSELTVISEATLIQHGMRGKLYDSMFVDNWTDNSNFARTIRYNLQDMMPLLTPDDGKLHLIGTGSDAPDPTGLIKSVHAGKSHFQLWDMGMNNRINELSIM